ncbi:hypothetical protein CEXT_283591 [Caerostris extrusa]|uniref:Uncharacterized protein n=1 Tax=Caerostris extrusa TaxID=172846 RepID=A0AAV4VVK7_CAEEX|nr:hypothetical protein CEXT_283591 [Caerostris extrusa]
MEINCHTTGLTAQLNFKPAGWFGRDLHRVEGFFLDSQRQFFFYVIQKEEVVFCIWNVDRLPEDVFARRLRGIHENSCRSIQQAQAQYFHVRRRRGLQPRHAHKEVLQQAERSDQVLHRRRFQRVHFARTAGLTARKQKTYP